MKRSAQLVLISMLSITFFLYTNMTVQPKSVQLDIVDYTNGVSILQDYPAMPHNFNVVNYELIARRFDRLAFNRSGADLGDRPIAFMAGGNARRPLRKSLYDIEAYQMKPYVQVPLKDGYNIGEGVASIPTIISSSLIGIDMTKTRVFGENSSRNMVRTIKRNYHPKEQMFGNYPAGHGGIGGSFWYDILPNIYAMQAVSLYPSEKIEIDAVPGEPTFDEMTRASLDTFAAITDHLRFLDRTAPSIANFNFSSVKVIDRAKNQFQAHSRMMGSDGPYPEPDAAAGVAILGVMGYERYKDKKYLAMAQWSLNFLDRYGANPYYEVLQPYGALAAARMNAQFPERGYNYNLRRQLQHCFSESSVRQDHGSLSSSYKAGVSAGLWGQFPMDGMWGPRGNHSNYYNGMAHYKNSILQAVTLAPIARYNTSYASALGRYLLNVASNAKVFFSDQLPPHHQDATTLTFINSNDPLYRSAVPYESIRKNNGPYSPMAKGDAVQFGWAGTDLSLYSGSETGYLAAILKRTSRSFILQWDLLKTDFNHPAAYPTYLVYNPKPVVTRTRISLNQIRKDYPEVGDRVNLYDSVSDTVIAADVGGTSVVVDVPAEGSLVLVVTPAKVNFKTDEHKRRVDTKTGIVIDYNYPSPTAFNEIGNPIR